MKKNLLLLCLLAITLLPSWCTAAANNYITMNVPQPIITDALQRVLPLTIDGNSSNLEGTIIIARIDNLRIVDQKIFCHLELVGNNLSLITRVANQDLRLKIGSAQVDFDCETQIRYDSGQQALYIRPVAKDVQSADALREGDVGKALLVFLDGREFRIAMQDIEPIIAEASDKVIIIQTRLADIRAVNGALQFSLEPAIRTAPKKQ